MDVSRCGAWAKQELYKECNILNYLQQIYHTTAQYYYTNW